MKTAFKLIVLLILVSGCDQSPKKTTTTRSPDSETRKELRELAKELNSVNKNGWIHDTMVPITLLDEGSKNVYEKYGFDVGGNCYACDLANVVITSKKITFTNVCSEAETQSLEVKYIRADKNWRIIETSNCNISFTKVEDGPVYECAMSFKVITDENLKVSKYFTTLRELRKFKIHDCGDFDG